MGKFNLNKTTEIYNILKEYNGVNPYIKSLKKGVYITKNISLNDFQLEYIISNYNKEPKLINKTVKITEWWGEKKKIDWNIDFVPQKIIIGWLLGETKEFYHVYIQYRKSQTELMPIFIPKSAIITDFTSEDWMQKNIDFSPYNAKSGFTLKPHQERAVKFLTSRKKGILSLDMGMGKSATAVVAALEAKYQKILVVCPASLKENWRNEISRFTNEDKISIVEGSNWKESKFTILNYDILKRFYTVPKETRKIKQKNFTDDGKIEWKTIEKEVKTNKKDVVEEAMDNSQLFQSHFDLIIIDEAHRLSNKNSGMYEIMEDLFKRTNPDGIYELTGTMIKNNPVNLYNILKLIGAEVTKDWVGYMTKYCGAKQIFRNRKERDYYTNIFLKQKGKKQWIDLSWQEKQDLNDYLAKTCKKIWIMGEPSNLEELGERIKHLYYREVTNFEEMGIKKQTIIKEYELSAEQKQEYDNAWQDFLNTHEEKDLDKLIQNHKLIEGAVFRQLLANFMVEKSINLAEEEIAKGKRVIIFCCFDKELYDLQEHFKDRCVVYNGKMTLKKKEETLKKFKENEDIKVFIGNIESAGVGINLNEASVCIFNTPSFVPASNNQAEFRCCRLGQDKDIIIYYQRFKSTYLERLFQILSVKTEINNVIIKSEDEKVN